MNLSIKGNLSFLYFRKNFRRYLFLLIALSFGFGVITMMTGLTRGMISAVRSAAQNHYGGDLLVIAYNKDQGNRMRILRGDLVIQAATAAELPISRIVKRTNYYREGILYFAGKSVRQKNVYGVEWDSEKDFKTLDWAEGSPADLKIPGSILISTVTADALGCRLGDDLTLEADTITGQRNTASLVVRGIVRDSSIFGAYSCYLSLPEMNAILGYSRDECSSYGFYLADGGLSKTSLDRFYHELSTRLSMAPPITSKEELTFQLDHQTWQGYRYFLIPLGVFISQVDDLLKAMNLISYFLYVIIILTILVSVGVTYRLVIQERIPEIATLRAMGFPRAEVVQLFLLEAVFLFVSSVLAGIALAAGGFSLAAQFSFGFIPGFEIFLRNGRLLPELSGTTFIFNIILLLVITMPAVFFPVLRASRLDLPKGLAGEY